MTHDELLASIIDYGENGPIDYGQIDLSKAPSCSSGIA